MKQAVLLLLHQGRSFTREAAEAAARQGVELVGLSSRTDTGDVSDDSRPYLADWVMSENGQLRADDVSDVVRRFADRGYAVRAAVATYEGYRLLMADLNERLGARDSSVDSLRLCLNKYALRQFLLRQELSDVACHLLDGTNVPDLDPSRRWFVKPVRGASSFAAFLLEDHNALAALPTLQEQMRGDRRMSAIFMGEYDFVAEEYVEGPEFSFETVLVDGVHHLCVHEKARVDRLERTTLEAMSVSPPISVSGEVLARGADHVSRCLEALGHRGLTAGALHVEAKYWTSRDRWEIIEVNPRMGGSMINESVDRITGESVLDIWMETLITADTELGQLTSRLAESSQLATLANGAVPRATVFLSKYGEKGRTIKSILFDPADRAPALLKMHAAPGTSLEDSDRAICLMDALWDVDPLDVAGEAADLDHLATRSFHVEYE